jgi:hypothetical protein
VGGLGGVVKRPGMDPGIGIGPWHPTAHPTHVGDADMLAHTNTPLTSRKVGPKAVLIGVFDRPQVNRSGLKSEAILGRVLINRDW